MVATHGVSAPHRDISAPPPPYSLVQGQALVFFPPTCDMLERDAWSLVKRLWQATYEFAVLSTCNMPGFPRMLARVSSRRD